MNPGEIRLLWFPFNHTEPAPFKRRPVVVLGVNGSGPDRAVLVAMITASGARIAQPGPGDIYLTDWKAYGLRRPSVIRTRRVWSAEDRDFVPGVVGWVPPDLLEYVRSQVRRLLD